MDAFDADVLIYAATGHARGEPVRRLFQSPGADASIGVGSVLLLPEVLSKPVRGGLVEEVAALTALLGRLDLHAVSEDTARLATYLGSTYRLDAADAVHLATAVVAGADRFITGNSRDFTRDIVEIDITYPGDLAA